MTLGAWMLLISLCLVVILALVVWGLLEQVKSWRFEALKVRAERDQYKADLAAANALAGTTHKIEETRNERKDAVASGGFAGSLGVLHDVATNGTPRVGKTSDHRGVAPVPGPQGIRH